MDAYEDALAKELGSILLGHAKEIDRDALANRCDAVCRRALNEIRAVVRNGELTDFDCIEEIVRILEQCGSDGGARHDFG